MSRYPREDRPPEPRRPCYAPEKWSDLADWEESRGDHYKAKVEELEEERKNFIEEADRLEDFSNFAISYLIERVNDLLEKTGEQGSDAESWVKELKRLYLLNDKTTESNKALKARVKELEEERKKL